MASLNKVLLIGNLAADPEVRYTPKGMAVTDIRLAVNHTWRTEGGENKEEVCFVTVTIWGKQAETAGKYLKKGRPVFIEGRLKLDTWEKNGEKRSMIKVICERMQFVGPPPGGGGGGSARSEPVDPEAPTGEASSSGGGKGGGGEPDLENDDIPF
ncbi:MAG: single-stranded DNA-binding protein [Verrucomicrobiae bacterium]|nr:single-stranded DNA-binding protein [Verrucomicrobiae bacterium]